MQKKAIINNEIAQTGVRNEPRLDPVDYSSHGTAGVQSVQISKTAK